MRQAIFAIVENVAIIAPASGACGGNKDVRMLVANSKEDAEMAVQEDRSTVPVVSIERNGGPARAVHMARRGAKIVICVGGSTAREDELRALAATSFVLRATTATQLSEALRAAFDAKSLYRNSYSAASLC